VDASRAYRFVPCDDNGHPRENSQYTTITHEPLGVGSRIDATLFGYTVWEVVEVTTETKPLLEARDRDGNDLPLAGTVICRGVS
jgi:hypothetical protein